MTTTRREWMKVAAVAGGAQPLAAHQRLVLLAAGDPTHTGAVPDGRPVGPRT